MFGDLFFNQLHDVTRVGGDCRVNMLLMFPYQIVINSCHTSYIYIYNISYLKTKIEKNIKNILIYKQSMVNKSETDLNKYQNCNNEIFDKNCVF